MLPDQRDLDMRPFDTDVTRRSLARHTAAWLFAGLAAATFLPSAAVGQVYVTPEGGINLEAAGDELIVELNALQSFPTVSVALADAGFPGLVYYTGIPARHRIYRLPVTAATHDVIDAVRNIGGVVAVRRSYRAANVDSPLIPSGQVVIRLIRGADDGDLQGVLRDHEAVLDREFSSLPRAYVVRPINEITQNVVELAKSLLSDERVSLSHPSFFFKTRRFQAVANIEDTFFPQQWHLNNTGQLPGSKVDADVDAVEAWRTTLGEGAVVAVIDDAVNWEHEDLIDNFLTGFDFTDNDDDPNPGEGIFFDENHGTSVAGLICARDNDFGVRGVAPRAQLIALRALSAFVQDIALADALLFAGDNGAMVINNSWGGPGFVFQATVPNTVLFPPDIVDEAAAEVAMNARGGLGSLVMFASGNDALPVEFGNTSAARPKMMAIGAAMRNDELACYSNFGKFQSVVAPSGGSFGGTPQQQGPFSFEACFQPDMVTTDVMDSQGFFPPGYNPPLRFVFPGGVADDLGFLSGIFLPDPLIDELDDVNYTRRFSGTSAACPVAAGVAALVYSIDPDLRSYEVRNILEHTAVKVTSTNATYDPVTGHNENYGHGHVNAQRAVAAALSAQTWPNPIDEEEIIDSSVQGLVRMSWTLPDWNEDGEPDEDVESVLVVRGPAGQLHWAPTDGEVYLVGQQVAPGIFVEVNDFVEALELAGVPEGEQELAFFTRNRLNFYSWGRKVGVDVDPPGGVTAAASIRATPQAGAAPLFVKFAGGGISPTGFPFVTFNWNFGDGTTGSGTNVEHIYTTPGDFIATVTAIATDGQTAAASVRIVVLNQANTAPQPTIVASPKSGAAPLVVTFEAIAADADGVVVRYDWDFGDGTTGTGRIVEHAYIDVGAFGVVMTATDDLGGRGIATTVIRTTGDTTSTAGPSVTQQSGTGGDGSDNPSANGCANGMGAALPAMMSSILGVMFIRRRRVHPH